MKVLCFQPHNDDCAIALGGSIQKVLRKGWDVTYVYLTDGRHGSDTISPAKLIKIRREEAARERNTLGIGRQFELGIEDGTLSRLPAATVTSLKNRLRAILTENDPDIVLLPTASDMHPDHAAAHRLAVGALEELPVIPLLLKYFVWLLPDFYRKEADPVDRVLMVGIDGELPLKMSAIRSHRSQVSRVAFDSASLMLSGYLGYVFRSQEILGSRYVEILGISGLDYRRQEYVELEDALQPAANMTEIYHGRSSQKIRFGNI